MNKKIVLIGIIMLLSFAIIGNAIPSETLPELDIEPKTINVSIGKLGCESMTILIEPAGMPRMLCFHAT